MDGFAQPVAGAKAELCRSAAAVDHADVPDEVELLDREARDAEPERESEQRFGHRMGDRARHAAKLPQHRGQRELAGPGDVVNAAAVGLEGEGDRFGDVIGMDELQAMARERFGDLVKGVVDLGRGVLVLDADLHADQEAELLAEGSRQADLWGINLYPDMAEDEWLEFDSVINLRPSFGNRSRGVDDPSTQEAIARFVARVVRR